MTEFLSDNPEARRSAVRQEQIDIEERLREAFLPGRFFQEHIMWPSSADEDDICLEDMLDLRRRFMEEKRDMNMGQRLNLALQPPYFGRLHVVELGLTNRPGVEGEIDGLKHQYHDLLNWMTIHGLVEEELPRQESGRTIELRKSKIDTGCMVVVRNRPLVDTRLPQPPTHIGISKRMVFSLPRTMLRTMDKEIKNMAEPVCDYRTTLLDLIEREMDAQNPQIDAIRTAYYLAMQKLEY